MGGNIEYVEYRFVSFLNSLSEKGKRGRESLRGSSSILTPTLEESKRRSIRSELLLLLLLLPLRRWKFRDVCVAEMRGRISRVTRTILFRLPHRLRINRVESRSSIYTFCARYDASLAGFQISKRLSISIFAVTLYPILPPF